MFDRPIDLGNPLSDWSVNRGTVGRWQVLPNVYGGYTWADLSPNRNKGTLTNMTPGLTSGWGSTARPGGYGEMRFDGVDDYIPTDFAFGASVYTVSCWANTATIAAGYSTIVEQLNHFSAYRAGSDLRVAIGNGFSFPVTEQFVSTIASSAWFQVSLSWDGSVLATYFNGVQVYASSWVLSYLPGSQVVRVGIDGASSARWSGSIDIVTVHNRALTPAEVLAKYRDELAGCPDSLRRADDWTMCLKSGFVPTSYYYQQLSGGVSF